MKKLYNLSLCLLLALPVFSQTKLIGGSTGNGDFENGTTGWNFVNGSQLNKWVIAPGNTGNCAMISADPGAPYSHRYDTSSASFSYFYTDIAVPAGSNTLWLNFDYICRGEFANTPLGKEVRDALRIYAVSPATTITAGTEIPDNFPDPSSGYYDRDTWKLKQVRQLSAASYAGGTLRLVFQWLNNSSLGNQPPAAVDNIEVFASCQEFIAPTANNANITATTAQLIWSTINGATGYRLRYKKVGEPETVSTYTNPLTIAGGNTYFFSLSNLEPASTYQAEISPIGTSCPEYSSSAVFTTLIPPGNDDILNATGLLVSLDTGEAYTASFRGATPNAGLAAACGNAANNDVWFKFTAAQATQYIQTTATDYGSSLHAATTILLYQGDPANPQPVVQPCASSSFSAYQSGNVSKLTATGLVPGLTYYIRVITADNDSYENFRISVFNPLAIPDCPQLLQPKQDTVLNHSSPFRFTWSNAIGAHAYRLRIFEDGGAYTEIYLRDSSYLFSPLEGKSYYWLVTPYNALNQSNACTPGDFTTCGAAATSVSVTAANGNSKCATDSVLLIASSETAIQWFFNNIPIAGATNDSLWARGAGSYTVRELKGTCYTANSNAIVVTNKSTPAKPLLTSFGATSFCEGGAIEFSASLNINNQWFRSGEAIPGETGQVLHADQSGQYYVRVANFSTGCYNYSDTVAVLVNANPEKPIITATSTVVCGADSLLLNSSAATGNQWFRNGIAIVDGSNQGLYAKLGGVYTVRVSTGGCNSPISDNYTLTTGAKPAAPVLSATGSLEICAGDSIKLSSSLAGTHRWMRNASLISGADTAGYYAKLSGAYTALLFSNGCESDTSNSISVVVNPQPAKPVINANGPILTTAAGLSAYQWYLNDVAIGSATAAQHLVLTAGNYRVTVTDAKGCKNSSDTYNALITGLNDLELLGYKIALFPNPASETLTIRVQAAGNTGKLFSATLADLQGRFIKTLNLKEGLNEIPLTGLAQGQYLVTIRSGTKVRTVKVLKSR